MVKRGDREVGIGLGQNERIERLDKRESEDKAIQIYKEQQT